MKNIKKVDDLLKLFKSSMLKVSEITKKPVQTITRDTYCYIAMLHNLDRLTKNDIDLIGGFKKTKEEYFPSEIIEDDVDDEEEQVINNIVEKFIEYLENNNSIPTFKELENYSNIKTKVIKKYFENINKLYLESVSKNSDIEKLVFNEYSFDDNYEEKTLELIKKHKRFIITTAVSEKKVHVDFFNCLQNYAERNDALILVLPCQDTFSRKSQVQIQLDPILRDCRVIYKDTYLNNNLFISDIKVSSKQLLPLTGLQRLAQRHGSMILASTKLFLEYIPTSNEKIPLALMSTGAVTENNYDTQFYMSKRISKLGISDHRLSAIVVEIEDEDVFHFRQLQYCDDGCIVDLGIKYSSDNSIGIVDEIIAIFGDVHVTLKDDEVHEIVKELITDLNIKEVLLHDIADCGCISHHTQNKPVIRAMNILNGQPSTILEEGKKIVEYLEDIGNYVKDKIVVVYSNHDYFLQRYLEECRFIYDAANLDISLDLCKAVIRGENPLKVLIEDKVGLRNKIKIEWLKLDEDYKICGIQCANHGHISSSGSRGSVKNLEKCYAKVFSAHSHTPCIWRDSWSVGTLAVDRMGYNHGPSTWLKNIGLVYSPYGTRQLINFIKNKDDKYTWKI